jgi:O-antigen/teichoic acid export membrane protein
MKETSRFYSSLGLLVFLNAIVKPAWIFGIDRAVQNEVGIAAYGSYFSIFNLSIVLSFLLDWGLTSFFNRQLSARDPRVLENAGSFLFLKLLFAVIYAAVMFLVAWVAGIHQWEIISYVILIQVLTSLFVFFRAVITSQQWFRMDAWLSVFDKLLMIVLCGILLYLPYLFGRISIRRFLLLQAACTSMAILLTLAILSAKNFHFSAKRLWLSRQVFRSALPFAVIVLLMSFHSRIDGFLLERISDAEEAGKYAAAYRLLDATNMVGYLLASFLLPYVARHRIANENIQPAILNIRHFLLVLAITISALAFFLAPWIQELLYHRSDKDSIRVLQWCLPALIGYSLVQVYGTSMTATGNILPFIFFTIIAIILNTTINIVLIPSLGAKASCIAAIVSQLFCGLGTMWYCRQKLKITVNIRSGLIYIFIAAAECGFLYASSDWRLDNWSKIAGTALLALVIVWVTKLFNLAILKTPVGK